MKSSLRKKWQILSNTVVICFNYFFILIYITLSAGKAVKNLFAFHVLQASLLGSEDSLLCCRVLRTIETIWDWDAANFFLLEWSLWTMAKLAACVWRKPTPVPTVFFSMLERVQVLMGSWFSLFTASKFWWIFALSSGNFPVQLHSPWNIAGSVGFFEAELVWGTDWGSGRHRFWSSSPQKFSQVGIVGISVLITEENAACPHGLKLIGWIRSFSSVIQNDIIQWYGSRCPDWLGPVRDAAKGTS